MNQPIGRLFAIVLLLFAALVAFTSRWSVFDAQALRDNPKNRRALIEQQRVKRGTIRAADGTLLARSEPAGAGTYRRRYTEAARLLPQVVGFSDIDLGQAGIERSRNDELSGNVGALDDLVDQFKGGVKKGDDVRLSIDLDAQRAAIAGLAGRKRLRRGHRARDRPREGDGQRARLRPAVAALEHHPQGAGHAIRAPRCSTARRRPATRLARRSRSSLRRPRSTAGPSSRPRSSTATHRR